MSVTVSALYMCELDDCHKIALHRPAMAHERDTGHHMVRLTDHEATELRKVWRAQNRCWMCGGYEHEHEGCEP